MFSPRWRKVLRDLQGNIVRTILVVLSIAVGVFAIGMILGTNEVISRDLPDTYADKNPAHAELNVAPFDPELLGTLSNVDGVSEIYARRDFLVTQIGKNGEISQDEKPLRISFYPDIAEISVNKIVSEAGAWPPAPNTILVERTALEFMDVALGDTILIETPSGRKRRVGISGIVHDLHSPPPAVDPRGLAYANLELLDWLGEERTFDVVLLLAENDGDGIHPSEQHIKAVSDEVRNKIERAGIEVFFVWLPIPGEHPATSQINAVLGVLGVLGFFSLFLSGFLVVNIINSLLAQHVRQIGIMKSVGARTDQIFSMYIVTVIIFGLLSLFISVPTGALAAYFLSNFVAGFINFDIGNFSFSPLVVLTQIGVGVGVPVLASLIPVLRGSQVTIREAMNDQGVGGKGYGQHRIDQLLGWLTARIKWLSRPVVISLRNTIRRKGRLVLTLFTMILGGGVFISVISVYDSLIVTMDDSLGYYSYDVEVEFARPYRIEEIEVITDQVEGVQLRESWVYESARRVREDGSEGDTLFLVGVPPETEFINPTLTDGRWLRPNDKGVVVVTSEVLGREGDLNVGDRITLNVRGEEGEWLIVGLVRSAMVGPLIYTDQEYLSRTVGRYNQSSTVVVIGDDQTPQGQNALQDRLVDDYERFGLRVSSSETLNELRETIVSQFQVVASLLAIMAILIASVGGLGLMGTMSINVLERTREIGIMRAVGASNRSVLQIVMVEGIFIGLVSWLISAVVGYPIGNWLSNQVGINLLQSPLQYIYSFRGVIWWIIAILIIAGLASFFPARNASRITIRETLTEGHMPQPARRRKAGRPSGTQAGPRRVGPTSVVVGSIAVALLAVASYFFFQLQPERETTGQALAQITPSVPADEPAGGIAGDAERRSEPTETAAVVISADTDLTPTDRPTAVPTATALGVASEPTALAEPSGTSGPAVPLPTQTEPLAETAETVEATEATEVAVVEETDFAQEVVISNFNLNMRSGPSSAFDLVTIMLGGEPFEVFERSVTNEWYFGEILSTGQQGWIWANYTTAASGVSVEVSDTPAEIAAITPTPTIVSTADVTETVVSTGENEVPQVIVTSVINVNVRSGPSTAFDVVVILPNGEPFAVEAVSEEANWYFGEFLASGTQGWIWADNTGTADQSQLAALPVRRFGDTPSTASVNAENGATPSGTASPPATALPAATEIAAVTSTPPPTATGVSVTPPSSETEQPILVASTVYLNVRSGPGTALAVVDVIPTGELFEVSARSEFGNWFYGTVVASGEVGWVWAANTEALDRSQLTMLPTRMYQLGAATTPTPDLMPSATAAASDLDPTPTPILAPAGGTSSLGEGPLLVTSTLYLNVRSGPGTDNEVVGVVLPGDQFEVLATSQLGNWYYGRGVESGVLGWVWVDYTETDEVDRIELLPTRTIP